MTGEVTEAQLSAAIKELILWHNGLVFSHETESSHQGRNGNYEAGTPDLVIMDRQGRLFGVELKRENGTPRPSQIEMREQFRRLGYLERYLLVKPSDYVQKLTDAGIIGGGA